MTETRKLAAILAADVVGYSRLAGADEEGTLARLRGLRADLIDPAIAVHRGRVVKRTGDGALVEFKSAVDAVRFGIEIQNAMAERNTGVPEDSRIVFRIGIHVGDVIEEADGDLMGDGVNIAARLQSICEPGGVCLSAAAYEHARDRVKERFVDLGEQRLKNIARPVRVYALGVSQTASPAPSAPRPAPERCEPPRLSLVVLPFANIGGDREQDYFVDGVTESLTTDLSRISGAFVIGRNTAFTYRDKAVDLKQIGRELNVRYVLEGSVQRAGARMRVNVQLIEAETDAHLWAERFDKPVADLFDMQDEIVARLANRLGHELEIAEAHRAERVANPDSMDHYFLGLGFYHKGGRKFLDKARSYFDRAVELDPDNGDALARRAWVDITLAGAWLSEDRTERLRSAEADLTKALRLRADQPGARCALGAVQMLSKRPEQGILECERALAINPNYAHAHGWIGLGKHIAGRNDETEGHVLEALRLSPRDPYAFFWSLVVGFAKLGSGLDDEAVVWLNRSIALNSRNYMPYFALSAALAHLGRIEEAREAARQGLELNPGLTIANFSAWRSSENPVYQASRERMYAGMRLAGVPEG